MSVSGPAPCLVRGDAAVAVRGGHHGGGGAHKIALALRVAAQVQGAGREGVRCGGMGCGEVW